jgi:hypothetical protein
VLQRSSIVLKMNFMRADGIDVKDHSLWPGAKSKQREYPSRTPQETLIVSFGDTEIAG